MPCFFLLTHNCAPLSLEKTACRCYPPEFHHQGFPFEGAAITLLICITLIIIALILKPILSKKPESTQNKENNPIPDPQKVYEQFVSLIDKKLAFQKEIAFTDEKKKVVEPYAGNYLNDLDKWISVFQRQVDGFKDIKDCVDDNEAKKE